ncbi:MAG: hypothetical protein C4K60_02495 [Ideonella sp. MAG2]|nr:MAG: hypothetical protein C4K60_02495 [Ideonella sp. MAG2]
MAHRPSVPVNTLLRQALTLTALKAARDKVLANNGCPGVDGVTVLDFAARGDVALRVLAADILGQRYMPQPLRRLWLPRADKPPRGLAVPVVQDRIAQTALATALAPLAEAHAQDSSFAYRKGRSVQQAVARVERLMREGWRWVVEADIEHFFDTIEHAQVMAELEQLLPHEHDARSLIRGWLMAPIQDSGDEDPPLLQPRQRGVPQGSPISPLLANLVLDSLDEALLEDGHCLVRFADDFLILARSQERAQEGLALSRDLLERMALRLNPSKTRVIHGDQGFEFLGWHFVRTLAWPKQHTEPAGPPASTLIPSIRPAPVEGPDADPQRPASSVRPELVEGPSPTVDLPVSSAEPVAEPLPTLEPDDEAAPRTDDPDPTLPALAPLQRTLYLVDPQAELGVDKQRLVVRKGERTLLAVSALNVDQVMVFGPVQVSTQALQLISRSGGAVGFLSQLGR